MTKFSIVIAVYNKAEYIASTLRSVLDQTVQDFEIVIVNDGSTDSSEKVIANFNDDRIRYSSQINMGASTARNNAILQCSNPYIAFLDADDLWLPDHLKTIDEMIRSFPSDKVFATNSVLKINNSKHARHYSISFENDDPVQVNYFEASLLDSIVNSSTVVMHQDVLKQIGLYDTQIKTGEDTDLFIRLGLAYPVVFSPKVGVEVLRNTASLSQTALQISEKADLKKYEVLEATNLHLKKYLDQNRYSLCILAKRLGNQQAYRENFDKIDLNNLNTKQRRLLKLPGSLIRILVQFKKMAEHFGIRPVIRK